VLPGDVIELTTSFIDRHNDHFQFYIDQKSRDIFILFDDGYILSEMKSVGVSQNIASIIGDFIAGFGVDLDDDELRMCVTINNLGRGLSGFVQVMVGVDAVLATFSGL
jgi:hypothetical protein